MRIRIEADTLPGRACGPAPERPEGYHNVHVAVQGRRGQDDLHGLVPADAASATWELDGTVVSLPEALDLRGPQIHGSPGRRFVYLTWGDVGADGRFTMFRRAKLDLRAVPDDVLARACGTGLLVGTLGLTDDRGHPLCAAVRPPRIRWSAPRRGNAAVMSGRPDVRRPGGLSCPLTP